MSRHLEKLKKTADLVFALRLILRSEGENACLNPVRPIRCFSTIRSGSPLETWKEFVVFNRLIGISVALGLAASNWGATAGEAPMLAELVAAGSLPPLEERLPANPLVVAPLNEVALMGGRSAAVRLCCFHRCSST